MRIILFIWFLFAICCVAAVILASVILDNFRKRKIKARVDAVLK